MYYNIIESGERIRQLRRAGNMTRQQLADRLGLSVNALGKIESGANGAKIENLVSIAEVFHVSLDYLICGCGKDVGTDRLLAGLSETEAQFVRRMIKSTIENVALLRM